MPVTAKLSQAFYDRLGHQVADEMVDWFNQVDAANRSDLRELNELNFARFDATLKQQLSEFSRVLDSRLAEFSRAFERELAKLAIELKDQQVIQMRWMIGVWLVVLVAVMGLWIRR
jgi:hypothetical protein